MTIELSAYSSDLISVGMMASRFVKQFESEVQDVRYLIRHRHEESIIYQSDYLPVNTYLSFSVITVV